MTAADIPRYPQSVTLENCDSEPIHIPGYVQSHGALLAFDAAGTTVHASANAQALLGPGTPALGQALAAGYFGGDAAVHGAIAAALAEPAGGEVHPQSCDVTLAGRTFELIVHRSGQAVVAEFEERPIADDKISAFAAKAHRGMDKLRRQRSVQALLDVAVAEVRELTGFDRVMAYRFRHDDSGDVAAEARRPDLDAFLNRRYPASDIPAQARRLYTVNTLRLIADVGSRPVAVHGLAGAGGEPLDMSHCVLRSVSPVHIEYLTNMGVCASMSVSIVINGRLWGMLACHHMSPRQVPYSVRMACDVLGQILAANLQSVIAGRHAERIAAASSVRSRAIERVLHSDSAMDALMPMAQELRDAFGAGAVVLAEDGDVRVQGDLPVAVARELVQWLGGQAVGRRPEGSDRILALHALDTLPPAMRASLGVWCGLLALHFDAVSGAWLVFLRKEQVETINWGGKPEKEYVNGPLGPRLTPRGSFAVWRETVSGQAVPWSAALLEVAHQLLDELMRAAAARNAELHLSQKQLLAMLGHDLRDPLQAISMAATLLQRGDDKSQLGRRIQTSSRRMERLISQVLDVSRLQSGLGLGFDLKEIDMARLVDELVDEARQAHPDVVYEKALQSSVTAWADADRLAQLVGNLLSNARHHGRPGKPILVELAVRDGGIELEVRNHGAPIPPETAANLFSAFKRESVNQVRNKGGLGLGLYIAREVAAGHGGTLDYRWEDPWVVFRARFPFGAAA